MAFGGFGGGGGGAGLGSMLGSFIGGAAGSSFQPGSKAKDQATERVNQKYADFFAGMNQMASQSKVADWYLKNYGKEQSDAASKAIATPQAAEGGWDRFLSGIGRVGTSFITGLGAGLQSYNPNNPASSFGAALTASTAGLQAGLAREIKAEDVAAQQGQERAGMMAKAQTIKEIEDLGRPTTAQAAAASIVPGGEAVVRPVSGIAAGIANTSRAVSAPELFDIKVGGYPSMLLPPSSPTAAQRVMLMGGIR